MQEIILEKFWGKYISVPIMFLFAVLTLIPMYPEENESAIKFIVPSIVWFVLFVIYVVFVIKENALPKCKKDEKGILFIFKVGSDSQYKDFKFSVEENFKKSLIMSDTKIVPICINSNALKNYDLSNSQVMTELLNKTNCYFCIEFFVESDSLDRPQKYETTINGGVLSPNVSKEAVDFLINGLSYGAKPIHRIKFDSTDKIDKLKEVTKYLAVLSEYVISLLLVMCDKDSEALSILIGLYKTINKKHVLYKLICEALGEAIWHLLPKIYDKYYKTNDSSYLDEIEYYMDLANSVHSTPYEYNLNKAQLVFLKYRDITLAKSHINECKKINTNDHWKYSEAFLIMDEQCNPNVVFSKYKQLKDNTYNVVEIIYFIERILDVEPEKAILHLALGVLYDNNNDVVLSNCHFKRFINDYDGEIVIRKNILKQIEEKIDLKICPKIAESNPCYNCKESKVSVS